jgi:glycerate 2-kinase
VGDDDGERDLRAVLTRVFLAVAARIDGERVVARAQAQEEGADPAFAAATHVLAVGKVALPMWRGLGPGGAGRSTMVIAPAPLVAAAGPLTEVEVLAADHPHPTARSVAAARAALRFVESVGAVSAGKDGSGGGATTRANRPPRLLVLLSGGASSLLCAPAAKLTWESKRDAVTAVARAGATIGELNVVRKHLSAIKGGGLARATRAQISVRALSDVIGDDPATIGSGPFSADPSTFAQARAIVARLGVRLTGAVDRHLERGARGAIRETLKPGGGELDHVDYRVLAGPARVVAEARRAIVAAGCEGAGSLALDAEDTIEQRAEAILATLAADPAPAGEARVRILVGNGEPRVILPAGVASLTAAAPATSPGRGGRATHLALLMARGLAALPEGLRSRVAFLAAGTDDRDGNTDVAGAAVDASTWERARALGLDPEAALRGFDSLSVLAGVGATVRGPGTSNLLDLHLLAIG